MSDTPAFKIVIPARLGSTRLPDKPLLDVVGKPLVVRTADQAAQSVPQEDIIIATDSAKIIAAANRYGYRAVMTRESHASGTDRVAEVAEIEGWDDDVIVVNLQGDEPLMPPILIREVATVLAADPVAAVATLAAKIRRADDVTNPNIVKLICDQNGHALYFSRATIPYRRDGRRSDPRITPFLRHIGLYAYRVRALKAFTNAPPAEIEEAEKLEQLRVLYLGEKIRVAEASVIPFHGVDTEQMLEAVRHIVETEEQNARGL